ncbi:hypothetical protein [Paenibacillus sp. NPDC058174]
MHGFKLRAGAAYMYDQGELCSESLVTSAATDPATRKSRPVPDELRHIFG